MLDSLTYRLQEGKLFVTITGADNLRKAIYTSVDRPWVNLTRADVTAIMSLVDKMLKDGLK
jgi:hypothetical protein